MVIAYHLSAKTVKNSRDLADRLRKAEDEIETCKRMLAHQSRLFEINDQTTCVSQQPVAQPSNVKPESEEPVEEEEALDTTDLAHKVLVLLASHKVSTRIFAKLVLNMSRQNASELLYKPKVWYQPSARVRRHYRTMHSWLLAAEHNVHTLAAIAGTRNKPRQEENGSSEQIEIDTANVVRKVKELLSEFSISQRLFARCILGLARSTVSGLLARPKPWKKGAAESPPALHPHADVRQRSARRHQENHAST